MASKVQLLSDFIVTKATNQNMTITQLVNLDNAIVISAIPEEHRGQLSAVVFRKAKQSAVHKYINQKTQELAGSQSFKDSIKAIIPELVVTEEMIREVVIQKVKELRA